MNTTSAPYGRGCWNLVRQDERQCSFLLGSCGAQTQTPAYRDWSTAVSTVDAISAECGADTDTRWQCWQDPGFVRDADVADWARPMTVVESQRHRRHASAPDVPAPAVFPPGGPTPQDVAQGALGDCWLCALLAGLATHPRLLDGLIYPAVYNPHGVYAVRLWCEGPGWCGVLVDDCFSVVVRSAPDGRRPPSLRLRYAKSTHGAGGCGALWVPLLEKAIAKVAQGYGALSRMHPSEDDAGSAFAAVTGPPRLPPLSTCATAVMVLLTGAAATSVPLSALPRRINVDRDVVATTGLRNPQKPKKPVDFPCPKNAALWKLWEKETASLSERLAAISVSGGVTNISDKATAVGLIRKHAYTVLATAEVPSGVAGVAPLTLLRLRNPWGRQPYRGPWSPGCPRWRQFPAVAAMCGVDAAADGLPEDNGEFWIALEDAEPIFCATGSAVCVAPECLPAYPVVPFKPRFPVSFDDVADASSPPPGSPPPSDDSDASSESEWSDETVPPPPPIDEDESDDDWPPPPPPPEDDLEA